MEALAPRSAQSESWVPVYFRIDGPNKYYVEKVHHVYIKVIVFIRINLDWLKDTGGAKILVIKFPDAVVSLSKRIGPATHIPGKMINRVAEILMPLHKLGGCASTFIGFAEVGSKFPAMFNPSETQVKYVVRDGNNAYKAQFPLNYWEQKANQALNVADWTLSFTGCAGYIWRSNHTAVEKFPLAPIATWSARYMSLKGLYFDGRFLYETLWVGNHQKYNDVLKTYVPIQRWDNIEGVNVPVPNTTVAWEEVAGAVLKISLSIACLSLDIFKGLAAKGNSSPWLDTAIFCANLAPTFITPVAMRYWPKMAVEPIYATASA